MNCQVDRVAWPEDEHSTSLFEEIRSLLKHQQSTLQALIEQRDSLQNMCRQQHVDLGKKLDYCVSQISLFAMTSDGISEPLEKSRMRENNENALSAGTDNKIVGGSTTQSESIGASAAVHSTKPSFAKSPKSETPNHMTQTQAPKTCKHCPHLSEFMYRTVTGLKFDIAMGCTILLHVSLMVVRLQCLGYNIGFDLGVHSHEVQWPFEDVFFATEWIFSIIYVIELALRTWAQGWAFYKMRLNQIDALVVLVSIIDNLMASYNNTNVIVFLRLARVLRIFRSLKAVKVLKLAYFSTDMRILMRALGGSLTTIFWSMLLLVCIIAACAMFLSSILADVLVDESIDLVKRQHMYENFGTFLKASYSIFESTFSSRWQSLAQQLITQAHPAFSLFWIPFVVVVNFTAIRLISALFLKQVLVEAAADAEKVAIESLRKREKIAVEVHRIFQVADTSGDGKVSQTEFKAMMMNPDVLESLAKLELDVEEAHALFDVLSADDGVVDYEEFINASLQMKNGAHKIDMIQVLHGQITTKRSLDEVIGALHLLQRRVPTCVSSHNHYSHSPATNASL